MVLAELGSKLTKALGRMKDATIMDEGAINDMLKEIQRALLEADVQARLVMQLSNNVKAAILAENETAGYNKRKLAQSAVVGELKKLLDPQTKPYAPKRGKPNVVCFVGLQGSGKTTTVTKYALYYQKKGYKTGVVCADTFRAGAYDQLRQNAMKAKVQFYGSITESDPVQIAAEGVEKFKKDGMEIIVVDTSGRHMQEEALFQEMEQVVATVKPDDIVFTLDSSIGQAAFAQAEAFKSRVPVGSVIITKLDGHAKGGGAISAVSATKSPITFIGTGEHFEEFEVFSSHSFVSRLLGMGDVEGLVDKIKTAGIDQNTALYSRMTEGDFTMRDMYEHLENVLKLGPMGSFMDMLPGLPQGMFKGNREKESTQMLRTFLTIIDSMTEKEKDHGQIKKIMLESRIRRLAQGSGRSIMEVHDMLKTYTKFEEMVKKIGKMRFKQMAKDPSALLRNNGMQNFAKAIDPRVLQQMGGAGGLQKMIKQFSQGGMGGMGNMGDMSKMFGM